MAHQYNIRLAGVLELQVLDQAIRLQKGECLPEKFPYITRGGIPLL